MFVHVLVFPDPYEKKSIGIHNIKSETDRFARADEGSELLVPASNTNSEQTDVYVSLELEFSNPRVASNAI